MRRHTIFVIAVLVASAAFPGTSRAQLGGMLNVLTAPLRPVIGGLRSAIRPYHRHRHAPRHYATRAATAATAGAAAAAQAADVPKFPVAVWPAAYDDLTGYIFEPGQHAEAFFSHGYGDVAQVISPRRNAGDNDGGCRAAPEHMDWTGQLTQSLQLTDEQKTSLDPLRAALTEAARRIDASCAQNAQATPNDRLRAAADRLWSVWDASLLIRSPLEKFYNSLTDVQKAKMNDESMKIDACAVIDQTASVHPRKAAQERRAAKSKHGQPDMMGMLSAEMTKFLAKSCPTQSPATPVDRLDAATSRVNAILYVARSIDQALKVYAEAGPQQNPHSRKRR